jgi:mono/diheme cytochrome c family protein
MKRFFAGLIRSIKFFAILSILSAVVFGVMLLSDAPTAHALPEYATLTGEGCATCHVSPGGGGPRTLRGLLWGARNKPDQVPTLPGVLLAPGVSDGSELYDIACLACHGGKGEGIFGTKLTDTGLNEAKIRTSILRGRTNSGMPSFEGQFTETQLEALVNFVGGLSDGTIKPLPDSYLLPPARFKCDPQKGC